MTRLTHSAPVVLLISVIALLSVFALMVVPAVAQGPQPEPEIIPTRTPTQAIPISVPSDDTIINTPAPRPNMGLPVFVDAEDGRRLIGELHLVNPSGPSVLLLHQLYTDRSSWDSVVGALIANGINVLNVDVRGHGSTGGAIDWWKAADDVVTWMEWLRSTGWVRANSIATMGSSMGSSLALVGCASDPQCRTAIAISPGWSYYGLDVEPAFAEQFGDRPVLLVLAEWDNWPSRGVPQMVEVATNPVTVQSYPSNQHGMDLFDWHEDLIGVVVEWLVGHTG